MPRFVDHLVVDGIDEAVEIIIDPSEDDLVDARHKRLRHHWFQALREKERLPARADLNGLFLSEIDDYLVAIEKAEADLRYTGFGRAIVRAYGRDMTGHSLDEFPSPVANLFRSVYRMSEAKQMPVFTRHKPQSADTVGHWLRLVVPLSKTGLAEVGEFIVCNVPVGSAVPIRGLASER